MRSPWSLVLVLLPSLLPSLLVGAPAAAQPATPTAIGPAAAAWFDAGYPTATAPQPSPPPGVGSGQLLVEGATAAPSLVPLPVPLAPVVLEKALTALTFRIPQGATAATLVLRVVPGASTAQVAGKAPTGVTPQACPATGAFEAGGQQPFDAVPAHDCSGRTSIGALSSDGTQLVFADIGGLVDGSTLSVVLRPGTLGPERLVIDTPTSTALTLLPFDQAPVFDDAGTPVEPAPVGLPADPPTAPVTGSADPGTSDATPLVGAAAPGPVDAAPVLAPLGESGPAVPSSAVTAAAPLRADDSATRAAALAGLLLLTVVAAWLAFTDPRRTGTPRPEAEQWGYGAHRSARTGPTPVL